MGIYESDDSSDIRNMNEVRDFKMYLEVCNQLALKAGGKGNTSVGCIILHGNKIIVKAEEAGHSKQDITCHAEMEAMRKARKIIGVDMSECTLVSTHEPCVMCGYAIRFHKIGKVVYEKKVSHLGSVSSTMAILTTDEVASHWSEPPQIIQFKN
jgi:tRNA(adenine34) deaminase